MIKSMKERTTICKQKGKSMNAKKIFYIITLLTVTIQAIDHTEYMQLQNQLYGAEEQMFVKLLEEQTGLVMPKRTTAVVYEFDNQTTQQALTITDPVARNLFIQKACKTFLQKIINKEIEYSTDLVPEQPCNSTAETILRLTIHETFETLLWKLLEEQYGLTLIRHHAPLCKNFEKETLEKALNIENEQERNTFITLTAQEFMQTIFTMGKSLNQ